MARIHRLMRKGHYASRISSCAPVYFAGVLEYLCSEIIETAGNLLLSDFTELQTVFFSAGDIARKYRKTTIVPRHVMLAVKSDNELEALLKGVLLHDAGVKPHIEPALVKKKKEDEEEEEESDE